MQFPDQLEGDLTKLKSIVVSRQTCAKISQALGLREFLVLGKGMTTHPAVPPSVLSDVLESLIAAATRPQQTIISGSVADVAAKLAAHRLADPVLVFIGRVFEGAARLEGNNASALPQRLQFS